MLEVSSQLINLRLGSFECQQKISRDEEVLIEAQVKIACVDALTFKPTGIPTQIKLSMES
jgi:acyl-CoA thioesterase FadM